MGVKMNGKYSTAQIDNTIGSRDFIKHICECGLVFDPGRMDAIEIGDYIDMPASIFKAWEGELIPNFDAFPSLGEVRVCITKIGKFKIEVEAFGTKKLIPKKLFCDYYLEQIKSSRGST
jgi:hypothetical protein